MASNSEYYYDPRITWRGRPVPLRKTPAKISYDRGMPVYEDPAEARRAKAMEPYFEVQREELKFERVQAEQGWIGQAVDTVKSNTPLDHDNSSKAKRQKFGELNRDLELLPDINYRKLGDTDARSLTQIGEGCTQDAMQTVESYRSSQESGVNTVKDGATLAASSSGKLSGPMSGVVGGLTRLTLGALENLTGGKSDEEVLKSAVVDGVQGFQQGISTKIVPKIAGAAKASPALAKAVPSQFARGLIGETLGNSMFGLTVPASGQFTRSMLDGKGLQDSVGDAVSKPNFGESLVRANLVNPLPGGLFRNGLCGVFSKATLTGLGRSGAGLWTLGQMPPKHPEL